ncbi:amidohydrolase family protein [Ramlibacter sp.]|uniref:amidohydrolase family protein n=1 Tax=Ramlibacter sp. TaxID=1917967 RepID=UPI00260571E5|nr:amidohydrolase family protein [Ramlibacter sp.]MDB5954830.1 amidohydrolase [Ramlibacter sp.]
MPKSNTAPEWSVIRGGRLVEPKQPRPRAADLLLKGDTIHEIGAPGMTVPAGAHVIEAAGMLLHPGLVNAHTHGHGNLARGMGDRWTLELLLTAGPWISGNRSADDKRLTTLIGAAEMLLKGCTACYDLTFEFPCPTVDGLQAAAEAYTQAGMRAVLAPMVADLSFFEAIPGLMEALPPALQHEVGRMRMAPGDVTLQAMRDAVRGWQCDRDQVRLAIAPTIPHHCTDAFMTGCRDLAREHGLALHSHVSESKVQAIAGMRKYGTTLVAHLDKLGLIGPDFTVAHGVWLDDDDMRRLGDKGASVAHNPGSNMRLGSGLARMRRMLECGVNVGIGTDGSNCSDNQNMYEAMRLASMVSKVQGPDWQNWITTDEVLHAATVGSAQALGFRDGLGRIAPGYKADVVFLETRHINLIPLNNITNSLVHVEDGGAVHSVMVGGRMVVQDRKLLYVDLDRLAREAQAAVERLERLNHGNRELYARLEPVVGSFCPGLAAEPFHVHRYGGCQHCQ